MAQPAWPALLTNKDWQKKKGIIAKIAGETGIGAALNAGEAAFKKIDWKKMDATTIMPAERDVDNIEAKQKEAAAHYSSVIEPARAKLRDIRDAAASTASEWRKNKAIPSSAVKAVEAIGASASFLATELKDNSSTMKDYGKTFTDMIATKKKNAAEEAKKLEVTIKNLVKALSEATKTPSKQFWSEGNTSAHQRCRSMCNAIRNIPELKQPYWATWQKFGDEYHKDAPDGDPAERKAMQAKIKTVITATMAFQKDYKRHLG